MKKFLTIVLGICLLPSSVSAAIAFDNSESTTMTGFSGTVTLSTTVNSNTNGILVCYAMQTAGNDITGATADGVSMTNYGTPLPYAVEGTPTVYLFLTLTPPTGTYNVVVSTNNNGGRIDILCGDYTGVKQSLTVDNILASDTSGSTWSPSITAVAPNAWGIVFGKFNQQYSSETNCPTRQQITSTGDSVYCDSNGTVTAWAPTLTQMSGAGGLGGYSMTLAPATAITIPAVYNLSYGWW